VGGEAIQDLSARVGLVPETDLRKWLPRAVPGPARGKDQAPEPSRPALKERDKVPPIGHRHHLRPARVGHHLRPVRALQLATDPAAAVGPAPSAVPAAVPAPVPKVTAARPAVVAAVVAAEAADVVAAVVDSAKDEF